MSSIKNESFITLLRLLLALKLSKLAQRLVGKHEVPRDKQIEILTKALYDITTMIDYKSPITSVILSALDEATTKR